MSASLLYILAEVGKFESTIEELNEALERAVDELGKKFVFIFDFQQIYWIERERFSAVNSISFMFKNVLINKGIPVIGLSNSKHYEDFLSSDLESLKNDFEALKMKELPAYDIKSYIKEYLRRAKAIYTKLSSNIKRIIVKNVDLDRLITLVSKYMPYGDIPGKIQQMIDQVVTAEIYDQEISEMQARNMIREIGRALDKYKRAIETQDEEETGLFLEKYLVRMFR